MDFSHKLPAHLGGWPCRLLGDETQAEIDKGLYRIEYLITGEGSDAGRYRISIEPHRLTRIMPAEPSTPYVEGADGRVYRRLPGTNPGTGEALWKSSSGPVLTWAELSQAWEDQQKTQPVVPLAPVQAVQLPFEITSSDSDRIKVRIADNLQRQVALELADNWTWCEADEAEQVAWALLSAVWQVRGRKAHPVVTLVDGKRALRLCAECPTQALCLADANCRHLQSYGHRAGEGDPS